MLPGSKQELKAMIREAKAAGKDVSDLEAALKGIDFSSPCGGKSGPVEKRKDGFTYLSTGSLTIEDFGKGNSKRSKARE